MTAAKYRLWPRECRTHSGMCSIDCAIMEELWTSLFSQNYSEYYRGLVAREISRRIYL